MSDSEDMSIQEEDNKPGDSIKYQRPSSQCTKQATQWKFQTVEETTNSELLLPTQDGGKCSE
jgi:hypothetical protein